MAQQITCVSCGSDTFKAGQIELSPEGGYDVWLPCAECGTPHKMVHDDDPEFAKTLMEFFAGEPKP